MRDEKERAILSAATDTFVRYGFRRTKMADIAEAAQMSRPALYLVFENKEAIFRAVAEMMMNDILERIEAEVPKQKGLRAKLRHVFELWVIQPHELISRSPDAQDLTDHSKLAFAADIYESSLSRLRAQLAAVIAAEQPKKRGALDAEQIAELLVAATTGFKAAAKDTADLRRLVDNLVDLCVK